MRSSTNLMLVACGLFAIPAEIRARTAATRGRPPVIRTLDQAIARVHQLPEVKAWSAFMLKVNQRKALLVPDSESPVVIGKSRYYRINFMEDSGMNLHRWETFVVRLRDGAIFVDSEMDGTNLRSLVTWREEDKPMGRVRPQSSP